MLRPVGKPRVAEEIVEQLRTLILRGQYAVGDKLPPERKLAEELGVNRASLREAIKALEQMGLVRTRQGDGTRVLDFMQTAGIGLVQHLITEAGAPNIDALIDVLEFRQWFSGETARLAATVATAEELAALAKIADRANETSLEPSDLLKIDFEFHLLLTRIAKNRVMQLLINTIRTAVENFADFFAQFHPPTATMRKYHRELLKALVEHRPEDARNQTVQYFQRAVDQLRALKPA